MFLLIFPTKSFIQGQVTKKMVYAGPSEATAFGNIAAQLLSAGEFEKLPDIRKAIRNSFIFKMYS